ncbi:hypothetical protein MIND_00902500 [Mycena indigotica]|uniref:F-box domain-containing protein n=1 Tax=Mycena indigotica TaxID=2126181 RepID=A0A8H6W1H5_9AGAR|nr:uncharacterized protein MIND_00902500 [Mycena indigotica]KAF7299521.1 hypothetical protein MIND_00902500 [Mycena indigotica]
MPAFTDLPTETLSQIFHLCLAFRPDVDNYVRNTSLGTLDPSFARQLALHSLAGGDLATLEQVCSRFRIIIAGTPSLWNELTLDLHGFHADAYLQLPIRPVFNLNGRIKREADQHKTLMWLLKRALQRSQSLPLTLAVRSMGEFPQSPLRLIFAESRRWESVTLDVPPSMQVDFGPLKGQLPRLKELRVPTVYNPMLPISLSLVDPSPNHLVAVLASAEKLTQLEYAGPLRPIAKLSLLHLRRVKLGPLGVYDIPSLLQFMYRLPMGSTLFLDLMLIASQADLNRLHGKLLDKGRNESQISTLELSLSHTGAIAPLLDLFFSALAMPQLTSLLVHASDDVYSLSWPVNAALQMLYPASIGLRELYIVDIDIKQAHLLQLLGCLLALESLAIGDKELPIAPLITDSFFSALLVDWVDAPGDTMLLPKLKELQLWTCGAFSDDVLRSFLIRRDRLGSAERFRLALMWVPGTERVLSDDLAGTIEAGTQRGQLMFECTAFHRA